MDLTQNNARLLLIDTCGAAAGVALCLGDDVLAREAFGPIRASLEIVGAVSRMLAGVGWKLANLDGVGVVSGPGSFTGVRTGLAAAKGFCEAGGLPLAAVSRLEVLAGGEAVAAALDAGRGELYVRVPHETGARESVCAVEQLANVVAGQTLVLAEDRLAERLAERLRTHGIEFRMRVLQAENALAAAQRCLRAGGSDLATVDANYVRGEGEIYRMKSPR